MRRLLDRVAYSVATPATSANAGAVGVLHY